jgi:hypothetical protein
VIAHDPLVVSAGEVWPVALLGGLLGALALELVAAAVRIGVEALGRYRYNQRRMNRAAR